MEKDLNTLKYRCIGYHYEGKKITEIAKILGKSYMTIKRWVEKFKETKNLTKDRPRSGRPSKFSKRVEASIQRMLKKDPSLTYGQVHYKLKGVKKISKSAIAKYLKKRGTKYFPRNELTLSGINKIKRVEYAQKYRGERLSNIVFSDESKFDLNGNRRRFYKFRGEKSRPRIRFNPNHSIMVWGAISSKGKISLVEVTGRLNGEAYKKLLEENLFKQADEKHGQGNWVFQQDNAPCHKWKGIEKVFQERGVSLVKHPPQSPDLNPIETVWSFVKRRVYEMQPHNKETLRAAIFKAWSEQPNDLIWRTIKHLKEVFEGVIEAKGNYLK